MWFKADCDGNQMAITLMKNKKKNYSDVKEI